METSSSVRVVVRVRPLVPKEKLEDDNHAVETFGAQVMIPSSNVTYTYDHVFGPEAGQDDLWPCIAPLVDSTFEGYNATIFAYGQTGSGKTFTMGSGNSAFATKSDEMGIIPRALDDIFARIALKQVETPGYRAEVTFRFLEIYGDDIRDLLSQFGNGTLDTNAKVTLKEGSAGQVQVNGAREEPVNSAAECIKLLDKGSFCRTVGATDMNAESSRSHAILTITMTQHIPFGDASSEAPECEVRSCYFNFVDLAGSEKQKMTKAEGLRLKEGIDINKGLFVLGNVINALGDDTRRGRVHVPYRDSKLTRMLQDSLGGNSRTLMLCCVSPAGRNISESKSSLMYANRARNIQNKAVINRDEASAVVAELRAQVQSLQEELFQFRHPGADMNDPRVQAAASEWRLDSFGSMRQRTEAAENEVLRLTSEIKRWRNETDAIKEELLVTQGQRDYFRMCCEASGTGLLDPNGEEMGLVKEQLKTIQELQEKLRAAEGERDKAHMFAPTSSSHQELDMASFGLTADMLEEEQRLIEQAEQEIKREQEMLKQIQAQAVFSDTPCDNGDDDDENLSIEMELMQREFQKRQQVLGASVQDLSNNISLKEQMLSTLRRNAEGYERMRGVFEQRLKEMAEKERVFMAERDRLVAEMQTHQVSDPPRYHKLSVDLVSKDGELSALRKKQAEMRRFEVMKQKSDVQLRVLTNEISTMKRQKVDLLRKMQADRKKYEVEANERKREIMNLKREHQRDRKQIQKLGSEKDAQERVLKRRMEEVAAANRRLKQQQLLLQTNRKTKAKTPSKDEVWLETQIKKLADQQKKAEQLEEELAKREKIVRQMERLYGQRNKLQDELQASLAERATGDASAIRDILISPLKSEAAHGGLGKEEEAMLAELEERIEACQAQLEYKDERISEMASSSMLVDLDDDEAIAKMETSSLPEARTLLKLLFSMAVGVKKQEEAKDAELQSTLLRLGEIESTLLIEKERNNFMRQTYEEKLQQMIAEAMGGDPSRLVQSASEEQVSVLRRQCEELSAQAAVSEAQKAALQVREQKYKAGLATCRERIKWLEAQVDNKASSSSFLPPPAPTHDDGDVDMACDMDDHMSVGSASSDTAPTSSSIFNRLSNPTNFTGIHRHRLQENAREKREILKNRNQNLRSRRLKDRNLLVPPPTATTSKLRQPSPSLNVAASPRPRASTPRHPPPPPIDTGRRSSGSSAVMDVLATLKKENEQDMDDCDMDGDHSDSVSEGGYESPKPKSSRTKAHHISDCVSEGGAIESPQPQAKRDVFSRLNNQYTASSQYKRHSFIGEHKAQRNRELFRSTTDDANDVPSPPRPPSADPLTGSDRFLHQVIDDAHDDAR